MTQKLNKTIGKFDCALSINDEKSSLQKGFLTPILPIESYVWKTCCDNYFESTIILQNYC